MLEDIAGALGGDTLDQLAGVLGADNDAVGKAVAAALPALIGGLARNSRRQDGASALSNALGDAHDGSILDSLGTIFGGNQWALQQATRDGEGILGHVFGQSRPRVEQQVQAASGLSSSTVTNFLAMLGTNDREELQQLFSTVTIAAIGPVTTATVREHGLNVAVQPEKFTITDMVQTIVALYREKKNRQNL